MVTPSSKFYVEWKRGNNQSGKTKAVPLSSDGTAEWKEQIALEMRLHRPDKASTPFEFETKSIAFALKEKQEVPDLLAIIHLSSISPLP